MCRKLTFAVVLLGVCLGAQAGWPAGTAELAVDPVSLQILRTWVYENRVLGRDMVSSDGGKTWTLAERTPELIPFFPYQTNIKKLC